MVVGDTNCMILYLLGVLTGLVVALLHVVLVKKEAPDAVSRVSERLKRILPSKQATIVDMADPIKDLQI